jgi:hypothetical protein
VPNYVIDIEWPLSGMEVNANFTASVKVRNEDDVIGGPAGSHFIKCTVTKTGGAQEDTNPSGPFDPDTEPLVPVPLTAATASSHKLKAELIPTGTATVIATDEELNIRINLTGGPSTRPTNVTITPE